MSVDPETLAPFGCYTIEAAKAIAAAIDDAGGSGIVSAPSIELTSTVGGITFTSAGTINFNLPNGVWSLISSKSVNFDTTNGDPDVTSRINFLSGEGIQFTASQAGASGFIRFNTTHLNAPNLQVFANNAAAIAGGLSVGDLYRNGSNPDGVFVVH